MPQFTRVRALIVGGCFASLAAVVSAIPIAWSFQEGWDLYALFWIRGARPAPGEVLLVPIDQLARSRLFLPQQSEDFERCRDVRLDRSAPTHRNPDPPHVLTRWPRCLHARVVEALAVGQPAAIVMDISFRPRNDPSGVYREQDRALAAAIRRAGSVLLTLNIGIHRETGDHPQPVEGEIEAAALALAPFLVLGDQLKRADRFCTFREDHGGSDPCLPTVAQLLVSLEAFPKFRELLERTAAKDIDLVRPRGEELLADGHLQVPATLLRRAATSEGTANRVRAQLAQQESAPATDLAALHRLADVYLGPGLRYFNFYGPAGAFQALRYEVLAAGDEGARPSPGSLRDKVVFIGFAERGAPQTSEHFNTPFTTKDSVQLSGVELAATAYANLRDGSSIVPVPAEWRGLIVLLLGAGFTLLGVLLIPMSPRYGSLAIVAAGALYFAVALVLFEQLALWLPLTPVGIDVIGGFAAGLVELKRQGTEADRRREQAERERAEAERKAAHVAEVLRAMLPGPVADRIIDRNQKLSDLGESIFGICVMTDLQGYTRLFKTHTPEEVAQILDRYFEALFPEVVKTGGETIDVLGDSMLALWPARAPTRDEREKACSAALQLAAAAGRFREPGSDQAFRTRIGVEYGEMSMGMRGAASHQEYRPTGVPVNTASRLQELCKALGAGILVSGAVVAGLSRFLVREVGSFKLREVDGQVQVYELIGERALATPAQLELCQKFSAALAGYRNGSRDKGRKEFSELAQSGDGPAAFYLRLCEKRRYYGQGAIPQEGIQLPR